MPQELLERITVCSQLPGPRPDFSPKPGLSSEVSAANTLINETVDRLSGYERCGDVDELCAARHAFDELVGKIEVAKQVLSSYSGQSFASFSDHGHSKQQLQQQQTPRPTDGSRCKRAMDIMTELGSRIGAARELCEIRDVVIFEILHELDHCQSLLLNYLKGSGEWELIHERLEPLASSVKCLFERIDMLDQQLEVDTSEWLLAVKVKAMELQHQVNEFLLEAKEAEEFWMKENEMNKESQKGKEKNAQSQSPTRPCLPLFRGIATRPLLPQDPKGNHFRSTCWGKPSDENETLDDDDSPIALGKLRRMSLHPEKPTRAPSPRKHIFLKPEPPVPVMSPPQMRTPSASGTSGLLAPTPMKVIRTNSSVRKAKAVDQTRLRAINLPIVNMPKGFVSKLPPPTAIVNYRVVRSNSRRSSEARLTLRPPSQPVFRTHKRREMSWVPQATPPPPFSPPSSIPVFSTPRMESSGFPKWCTLPETPVSRNHRYIPSLYESPRNSVF